MKDSKLNNLMYVYDFQLLSIKAFDLGLKHARMSIERKFHNPLKLRTKPQCPWKQIIILQLSFQNDNINR